MTWRIPDAPPSGASSPGPLPRPKARNSIAVDVHASVGIIRPGDRLVVAVGRSLDMAGLDELRQQLEENLPGIKAVIVTADSLAVYRGDQ